MERYTFQIASSVHDDALSVELMDGNGKIVAEITRYDASKELKVRTFSNNLDLASMEKLIAIARRRLDPFEDGTPLNSAESSQHIPF